MAKHSKTYRPAAIRVEVSECFSGPRRLFVDLGGNSHAVVTKRGVKGFAKWLRETADWVEKTEKFLEL